MKINIKKFFDLFEETVFVPILVMVFIVSALAYSNNDQANFSGAIDKMYCQNNIENGDEIVVSGYAKNNLSTSGKIRLRFLVNGESVNNFYLANPATFSNKIIGKYLAGSELTMQAYNEKTKKFVDLEKVQVNCQNNDWQNFSKENSSFSISKNTIFADGRDFAILKIVLRDESNKPIVGQDITLHIEDYLANKQIKVTDLPANFTNQKGELNLQVRYDRHDQKIDRAIIGFSVGLEKYQDNVEVKYNHSSDNVIGSLQNVICAYDLNNRPILNISGIAYDPDNYNESVDISYYLIDSKSNKESKIGIENTNKQNQFATSFNREVFDFGDLIDVFVNDINSGQENYIGSVTPECQIK